MTQIPPYQPPSAQPAFSKPPGKPASLMVFGILNIVFGALGICGSIGSSAMLFMSAEMTRGNPVYEIMEQSEGYRMFLMVGGVIGVVMSIVLLVAGIGLIKAANWARVTSIGYGVFAIVYGIIGLVLNYFLLMQPLMERMDTSGPEAAGAMGGIVGGMFGSCLGLIYPVLLIIFMMRRPVVEATRPAPARSAVSEREAW